MHNVGGADKAVRIVAGVTLPVFALMHSGGTLWRGIVGVIGLTALATGFSGYCPVNRLLGINTVGGQQNRDQGALPEKRTFH
jgi:hypothetical protein